MGGQPCYLKLLMNGTRVPLGMRVLNRAIKQFKKEGGTLTDEEAYKVITHMNDAEDSMNKASKAFLDVAGYDGPVDHSLNFKE